MHYLRNLDDCYVDLEYILYKVITAKCCGSLYAVSFTLTLIPWQINVGAANPQVICLGSLMLMNPKNNTILKSECSSHESQQQRYTCHILRFYPPTPAKPATSNQPFLFYSIRRLRDCLRRIRTFLHLVHFQFTSLGMDSAQKVLFLKKN